MLYWGSRCIFTQSVDAWLAVSGGQPPFTLGLPMFVLSVEYFLSLPWGPSTNIDFFYLRQKYNWKDKQKFVGQILIKMECVSKIYHILSVIHYTICGAVCFQFTHFLCDDWDNIYILRLITIIKSEVWTITHCLGLGHETMVCAVCLSIFLWKRLSFFFCTCPFDALLGVTCKHAGGSSVEHAPHLQGSLWYGVLEAHWSYLRYLVATFLTNSVIS